MKKKLFGTDGIRGIANHPPMDSETMLALARTLAQKMLPNRPARVVIGKDTRASGYMLETALASGLISEGVNIVYTGPIPTPAIPFLIPHFKADLGIMLTASHNPWYDNGVKIFNHQGMKLSNSEQDIINQYIGTLSARKVPTLGQARHSSDEAREKYQTHLRSIFPQNFTLDGLKIVLDCAHGAAYRFAPELFSTLKPDSLIVLHAKPNGENINLNCGATAVSDLSKAVVAHQADIGLAFDGDADRLIAVDEHGQTLDGDQIMAAIVIHELKQGQKKNHPFNKMVCTKMSNMGLEHFLTTKGVQVHRTDIGDRYVLAKMLEVGARFGGEQSGHLIFREHGFSGDGVLSALKLLQIMQTQQIPAHQIGQTFEALAQVMKNIPVPKTKLDLDDLTQRGKPFVGDEGQILIRASGTEPVLRIMAQAVRKEDAEAGVDCIIQAVKAEAQKNR